MNYRNKIKKALRFIGKPVLLPGYGWLLLLFFIPGAAFPADALSQSTHTNEIDLDQAVPAQVFDGIGAVFSYEKLLYDYPEKQRKEILDYLFLPHYGAALQLLKVEMGYDGSNGGTAWPSHHRSLDEPANFNRGFVWWLMKEAKKRNPGIALAALHWGYPAYATTDALKATFIYSFVAGAWNVHRLRINYIGGNQNESALTPEVTKLLRKELDAGGFKDVKVVAADEGARVKAFRVLDLLEKDAAYNKAVDIIGVHYKDRPASFLPQEAYKSGKPLWSSEDIGGNYKSKTSANQLQIQFFKLFYDLKFSASLGWLATASAYPNMPWPGAGFINVKEPWSGHYEVGAAAWSIAHVTQFVQRGWKVWHAGDGYLYNRNGEKCGRYMIFADPARKDVSILVNTDNDSFPKEGISLTIHAAVAAKQLHSWSSDFTGAPGQWFVQQPDIHRTDGKFIIRLTGNKVYTLTTTTGQQKGHTAPPASGVFKLPYSETFEQYDKGTLPRCFVDANGIFEISAAGGGRTGNVLRQVIRDGLQVWHNRPLKQPVTEFGDISWTNYSVAADILLEQPGSFWLAGRFDGQSERSGDYWLEGYWLSVNQNGEWVLYRKDSPVKPKQDHGAFVVLARGRSAAIGVNRWAHLSLRFNGNQITAAINRETVATVRDSTYRNGNIAMASVPGTVPGFFDASEKYVNVQIDNLEITP